MATHRKIVHVCQLDKFIPPYIDFIEEHFQDFSTRHEFYIAGDRTKYPYKARNNVVHAASGRLGVVKYLAALAKAIHRSDKVILHGLFKARIVQLLSCMPWVHKKCYWVIWGGDLYRYQAAGIGWRRRTDAFLRRFVIRRLGHLVSCIPGEYELARRWYGASGKLHRCFTYPSNLYIDGPAYECPNQVLNIQIGNSADPANHHHEILERLLPFRDENIVIHAPLSYGDPAHAQSVADVGKVLFGDKFRAQTDFIPLDEYRTFLAQMDIAIFNHNRQQAIGNATTLLGLGKKVYLRRGTTSWSFYADLGVTVFDSAQLNISGIDETTAAANRKIISEYFSLPNLEAQLNDLFNDVTAR